MDTIGSTSRLETAEAFATSVHNLTAIVDGRHLNQSTLEISVPADVVVTAQESTLTISLLQGESVVASWSETYTHEIELTSSHGPGIYHFSVELVGDVLEIVFIAVP
jgi:hypothetical protein